MFGTVKPLSGIRGAVAIREVGTMLPAISADLPAYLTPPSNKDAGRQTTTEAGFGPSARVDLSTAKAAAAQADQPGNRLYGADGQFVEGAARRGDAAPETPAQAGTPAPATSSATTRATEAGRGPLSSPDVPGLAGSRDLSIESFTSAVPPAATEELRSLADRAERKVAEQDLSSRDYRLVAELMDRVGRHHEAKRAADLAKALDEPVRPANEAEEVGPAEEQAADASGEWRVETPTTGIAAYAQ